MTKITNEERAERRKKSLARIVAERSSQSREMAANKAALGLRHPARVDATDVAARLAEIPPDTRNLTQRLMGDPLPQRSALAKRSFTA